MTNGNVDNNIVEYTRTDSINRRSTNINHHSIRAIIAGGGTGGHLFPGIAIARELEKRFEHSEILFVVGHRRMESEILSRYGYNIESINVEGMKGRGWKNGISVITKLPYSFFQSISLINKFSPAFVIGVGGYSSGPFCLASRFKGIPTAIHEQNSYPGLTNRLLSGVVDKVFVSFDESKAYLKGKKLVLTGNPVREELFSDNNIEKRNPDEFTILVVGGSQGAMGINKAFAESLEYLNKNGRHPIVIHQSGKADYNRVTEDYRKKALKGELSPFIEDMKTAYNRADLVISRAGATTIFELAALGKPSILIPYPYATNRHQEINARSLVRMGGAEMILEKNLTREGMANAIIKYMDNRHALKEMGAQAGKMGQKNAAELIVDQILEQVAL